MDNIKTKIQSKHIFWVIILFAIVVRFLGIAFRPIWYDEAIAILRAYATPQEMIYGTITPDSQGNASEVHPLLYFFILSGWIGIWGNGIGIVRILSVLFSLGTIIFSYMMTREMFGERTALVAMFLVTLSPSQIHYGQEIRMYSLMTMFLIGAAWFCIRGTKMIEEGKVKSSLVWWGLFALFASLGQYSHNLSIFFLVPLAFSPIIWRSWRAAIATFTAGCIAALLYFPWFTQVLRQLASVRNSYWVELPAPTRLLSTLLSFITNLPLFGISLIIGVFASILVFTVAVWQTIRSYQDGIPQIRYWSWLVYLSFIPVFSMFLISQWIPVYIERALLPSGVIFLVWIAWILTQTKFPVYVRNITSIILLSGMIVGIYTHLTYRGFPYGPFEQINEYISEQLVSGDIVVHSNKLTMIPMYYDEPSLPHRFVGDVAGSPSDTLAPSIQEIIGLFPDESIADAVDNAHRVWFIIFDREINTFLKAGFENHPQLLWLDDNYNEKSHDKWGSIWLYEYIQ